MTHAVLGSRPLVDPAYRTARPSIPLPLPHEVDLAPQLIAVTLALAALAAAHRAIDSAHPILAYASAPGKDPILTDTEHLAMRVLDAGNLLANLLADYALAVVNDNLHIDDDPPF